MPEDRALAEARLMVTLDPLLAAHRARIILVKGGEERGDLIRIEAAAEEAIELVARYVAALVLVDDVEDHVRSRPRLERRTAHLELLEVGALRSRGRVRPPIGLAHVKLDLRADHVGLGGHVSQVFGRRKPR